MIIGINLNGEVRHWDTNVQAAIDLEESTKNLTNPGNGVSRSLRSDRTNKKAFHGVYFFYEGEDYSLDSFTPAVHISQLRKVGLHSNSKKVRGINPSDVNDVVEFDSMTQACMALTGGLTGIPNISSNANKQPLDRHGNRKCVYGYYWEKV